MAATRKTKPPPRFSAALRRAIADSDKSLYDVARAAGIPYSTMSRFIAGERVLALEDVDRLCQALDLELRPQRRNQPTAPRPPRATLPS